MSWTTPKTWAVDELLTAADLNEQLRDNMNALKSPPSANYEKSGGDYTINSTTWASIDATNLTLTLTTSGGDVMVGFTGITRNTGAGDVLLLDVLLDDTSISSGNGIAQSTEGSSAEWDTLSFTWLIPDVAAGEHTFELVGKVDSGSVLIKGSKCNAQFWAREVN